MKFNSNEYRDKVLACWIGKNIGGTMGTPYEGERKTHDIKGFVTEKNVVLPNDDLDLQLVWLVGIERFGVRGLTPERIGELWINYITPYWNEYGIGKTNLKMGLMPPLSGDAFNNWRDSNGAWIRTEIWACLAPGAPDVAIKYAYDDACVDHGAGGEGTVAAVFVAALESAAFFETDPRRLIEIGLSKISEESRMAKSVVKLLECYDSGMDYRTARDVIFELNSDIGDGWFEAPTNVTYSLIGLLWGGGDFKKSMIYTINCGDDTDCTAATLGSILGIMGGTKAIPTDWREHIGDNISSISLAGGVLYGTPKTCTELSERVFKKAPVMLSENDADVIIWDGETEIPDDIYEVTVANDKVKKQLASRPPYSYTVDFSHASAMVILPNDPKISAGESMKIKIRFMNECRIFGRPGPSFLKLRWILPEGFSVRGESSVRIPASDAHNRPMIESEFEIIAGECVEPINRLVLEAVAEGRLIAGYIPIVLLG